MKVLKRIRFYFNNFNTYKAVALAGYLIRVFLLPLLIPNVFEVIAEFFILKLSLPQWAYEILIRVAIAAIDLFSLNKIFYYISYSTVGCFYEGGSAPAWGSISYTAFYAFYLAMPIILINWFYWWVIALTFISYALITLGAYIISAKINALYHVWGIATVAQSFLFAIIVVEVCLIKHFLC